MFARNPGRTVRRAVFGKVDAKGLLLRVLPAPEPLHRHDGRAAGQHDREHGGRRHGRRRDAKVVLDRARELDPLYDGLDRVADPAIPMPTVPDPPPEPETEPEQEPTPEAPEAGEAKENAAEEPEAAAETPAEDAKASDAGEAEDAAAEEEEEEEDEEEDEPLFPPDRDPYVDGRLYGLQPAPPGPPKPGVPQKACLLYTSPSPRDGLLSRMPSSA